MSESYISGDPTVKKMIYSYLKINGYDGLYYENDCGCLVDDLAPCGSVVLDCCPGVKIPTPKGHDQYGEVDWIIAPAEADISLKWYFLFWSGVSHLIKPSRRYPDVSKSLCGITTAATNIWKRTDGSENPPRRCVTCTRIAKGLEGK